VEPTSRQRLRYPVLALLALLAVGTVGFRVIMDEAWVSALYRSVVTVSLTGLDTKPDSHAAEVFTILLLIAGVAVFAYVAGVLVEMIARGLFGGAWAAARLRRTIGRMHDHYVICGYGRVGRRIADELTHAGIPFVVLDFNTDALAHARDEGVPYVEGRGTEDGDLALAGLERARGILAASDSDSDNLYIVLSARAQRPDLTIVARASNPEAEKKLRLAGADRVVQPYSAAGVEMAKLAIKPQVAAFLDIVSSHGGPDLRFEEIEVTPTCARAGSSIRDLRVRRATGAVIVALRKGDGRFDTTPDPDAALEVGDVMIAVGTADELRRLEELFAPAEAVAT